MELFIHGKKGKNATRWMPHRYKKMSVVRFMLADFSMYGGLQAMDSLYLNIEDIKTIVKALPKREREKLGVR